ncbi:uncharacterized protein BT62DRAFT_926108 [Guyanagaster necrorhizus]|uniref:BTB domain-containing protein n=1 Tax=Guyanagaster necrorhizus TaxID=856835 RepID=A0A9P7W614_9AGAR|nr:uncharacterized protein BT62DRAFT_926108 [Guyanagaster necrorhizus MCA 3950]KAG7451916.1 hypothetical protein BT62DRAFT_926108 [Guyanagaster necrorhizus MCA 3950]
MQTTQLRNVTTADAPFNDPTDCVDLVIRTVDNVDFFVLSTLLSLRSPSSFFRNVLQDNHHTEERDGFPILEVREDSHTFRSILLLCYPCVSPEINNIEQLVVVGKALDKYCMDNACEQFVKAVIASPLIREKGLLVFVHAVLNGWKELGEAAAKSTLAIPLAQHPDFEDLKLLDALQYIRLQDYHRRCRKATQAVMSGETDIRMPFLRGNISDILFLRPRTGYQHTCAFCGTPLQQKIDGGSGLGYIAHYWVADYAAALKVWALGSPRLETAPDEGIIAHAVAKSVSQCPNANEEWMKIALSQIRKFGKRLIEEINRQISQVPLNIDWKK